MRGVWSAEVYLWSWRWTPCAEDSPRRSRRLLHCAVFPAEPSASAVFLVTCVTSSWQFVTKVALVSRLLLFCSFQSLGLILRLIFGDSTSRTRPISCWKRHMLERPDQGAQFFRVILLRLSSLFWNASLVARLD
jgi:hypothetical protein